MLASIAVALAAAGAVVLAGWGLVAAVLVYSIGGSAVLIGTSVAGLFAEERASRRAARAGGERGRARDGAYA